ncbi:baculoviral IAP repeat-containing protein 2-like [Penaeus indicus]|uniref:baculoviral IAP repeat-containing protein 2-like n=1 Tax=Penaeus indicus TaxID=29960 RepID=UPI00300C62F7
MSDPGNIDNATEVDRDLTRMCEETHRTNTYGDCDQYVHHPKIMAKAGFYELDKRLICFRCGLSIDIDDIGKTDDIVEVHQTKSPKKHLTSAYCDFAMRKVTGNVPIRIDKIIRKIIGHQETDNEKNSCGDNEGRSREASGEEDGGDSRESENDSSSRISVGDMLSEMGIESYSGPEHENLATPRSRKYTYGDWPLGDIMRPKRLIAAGFFYSGYGDHVICFHCGVGIRNWEKGDDPWTQHAMWNPECRYVRTLMGQTFIDTAKMVKSALFRKPTLERTYSVTDEDWNAVMGLDITKDLLMSLFPVAAVRDCIRERILVHKIPFITKQEGLYYAREKIVAYGNMDITLAKKISRMSTEYIQNYHAVYSVMYFLMDLKRIFIVNQDRLLTV